MALIADKKVVLESFKRMAETGMINKDYLITKLQGLVTDKDISQEEAKIIINILIPPEETV